MKKRIISMLLAIFMLVGISNISVFAGIEESLSVISDGSFQNAPIINFDKVYAGSLEAREQDTYKIKTNSKGRVCITVKSKTDNTPLLCTVTSRTIYEGSRSAEVVDESGYSKIFNADRYTDYYVIIDNSYKYYMYEKDNTCDYTISVSFEEANPHPLEIKKIDATTTFSGTDCIVNVDLAIDFDETFFWYEDGVTISLPIAHKIKMIDSTDSDLLDLHFYNEMYSVDFFPDDKNYHAEFSFVMENVDVNAKRDYSLAIRIIYIAEIYGEKVLFPANNGQGDNDNSGTVPTIDPTIPPKAETKTQLATPVLTSPSLDDDTYYPNGENYVYILGRSGKCRLLFCCYVEIERK